MTAPKVLNDRETRYTQPCMKSGEDVDVGQVYIKFRTEIFEFFVLMVFCNTDK
jgi:hypothetical protein